jgi:hypothetical protein
MVLSRATFGRGLGITPFSYQAPPGQIAQKVKQKLEHELTPLKDPKAAISTGAANYGIYEKHKHLISPTPPPARLPPATFPLIVPQLMLPKNGMPNQDEAT